MRSLRSRAVLAGITALGTIGLATAAAGPAGAVPASGGTEHSSFPAAGAVFECSSPTGDITALSGTVSMVDHWTVDGQGVFHETGTVNTHGVTLMGANGDLYTVSGASWFGGKMDATGTPMVFTDTEHWVLHDTTTGGNVKVQIVSHWSPGASFTWDKGTCSAPEG
ncbi:hypothetical protein GCM10022399_40770 [Terrabacter ginsenosidimutans]|jgi:hypothetical protein|uniref:Uncharacterized protein n=1 Tax=Terrabacter ginsenosidimutans TaxID=490575 RepID=A0ABP7EK28_9MICO